MKKLINTTQHNVSEDQLREIYNIYGNVEVVSLKDVNPSLFSKVGAITADSNVIKLCNELEEFLNDFDLAVMPIGSPYFMARFFYSVGVYGDPAKRPTFLFSLSERVVRENTDGTKTVSFKHLQWDTL